MEYYKIISIITKIFGKGKFAKVLKAPFRLIKKHKIISLATVIAIAFGVHYLAKDINPEKLISNAKTEVTKQTKKLTKTITKSNKSKTKKRQSNIGVCYEIIGEADLKIKEKSGIHYGGLDKLGRPTWASAKITKKIIDREKKEKRQDITVDPAGWPAYNQKIKIINSDGSVYKGYFYNRSHMIADSLGGDAVAENLITGTRSQNVGGTDHNGGMAYLENKIRKYFKDNNKGYVYYTVENFYGKDELLPRYSIVNAKSSDNLINEQVKVLNTANGYKIDYKTADFFK